MKIILALGLFLMTGSIFARTVLCEAFLVNTFSRTEVGRITIRDAGDTIFSLIKETSGKLLTATTANRPRLYHENSYQFENYVTLLKDNGLKISGLKFINDQKLELKNHDLHFLNYKKLKVVTSSDGFIFGACKK